MLNTLDTLEPRQLLAFDLSFTDVDGDVYRVEVVGNGTAVVTPSINPGNGFISNLVVSGTDAGSRLRITLSSAAGNGRVDMATMDVQSPLRSIQMPQVDVAENGSVDISDVGQLALGNVGQNSSVTVDDNGTLGLGAHTAVFGVVDNGSVAMFAHQQKVTFAAFAGSVQITDGADAIVCLGDWTGSLGVTFLTNIAVGSIKITGHAKIQGNVNGAINSLTAASFLQQDANNFLELVGRLGSLSTKGDNAGRFRAANFGTVAAANYSGTMIATTPDAKGNTFTSIKFKGAVKGGVIDVGTPAIGVGGPGVIASLSAASWAGGFLLAAGIGTWKVAGDASGLDAFLTGAPAGLTLKSLTVGGGVSGAVTVLGDAGAIKFARTFNADALTIGDGPANAVFKSITATDASAEVRLVVAVGAVSSLSVAGDLIDSFFLLTPAGGSFVMSSFGVKGLVKGLVFNSSATVGIKAFKALGLDGCQIDIGFITTLTLGLGAQGGFRNTFVEFRGADAAGFAMKTAKLGETMNNAGLEVQNVSGAFGAVTARSFISASLIANTIGSVTATGLPGLTGDVSFDVFVQATVAPVAGFSIGKVDLRGFVSDTTIAAAGSIDTMSILAIPANGETVRVAAGSTLTPAGFPSDLNAFNPAAVINKITITSVFDAGTPSFSGGLFLAPTINAITVNGQVNTSGADDGGLGFGFGARVFGKVTLKTPAGATIKPVISAVPGDYNVFAPDLNGNFFFVVYA